MMAMAHLASRTPARGGAVLRATTNARTTSASLGRGMAARCAIGGAKQPVKTPRRHLRTQQKARVTRKEGSSRLTKRIERARSDNHRRVLDHARVTRGPSSERRSHDGGVQPEERERMHVGRHQTCTCKDQRIPHASQDSLRKESDPSQAQQRTQEPRTCLQQTSKVSPTPDPYEGTGKRGRYAWNTWMKLDYLLPLCCLQ